MWYDSEFSIRQVIRENINGMEDKEQLDRMQQQNCYHSYKNIGQNDVIISSYKRVFLTQKDYTNYKNIIKLNPSVIKAVATTGDVLKSFLKQECVEPRRNI